MNRVKSFIEKYEMKASQLNKGFDLVKDQDWNSLVVMNELFFQISHVFTIMAPEYGEKERDIHDLGDELSDILLQLLYLKEKENIVFDTDQYVCSYDDVEGLVIVGGQLLEGLMEKYGYRFKKNHENFLELDDFIENRLLKMFFLVFNIAEIYDIDIEKKFDEMLISAKDFLKKSC